MHVFTYTVIILLIQFIKKYFIIVETKINNSAQFRREVSADSEFLALGMPEDFFSLLNLPRDGARRSWTPGHTLLQPPRPTPPSARAQRRPQT